MKTFLHGESHLLDAISHSITTLQPNERNGERKYALCPLPGHRYRKSSSAFQLDYQHLGLGKSNRSRDTCRTREILCIVLEGLPRSVGDLGITSIRNDTWSLDMRLSKELIPHLRLAASTVTDDLMLVEIAVSTGEDNSAIALGLRPLVSVPGRSCGACAVPDTRCE